ncbi:MAG TPA: GNAT family N-acetyltransferase, partial [Solirubrobacteraceae bacterium]|nr:GNAT family N-acetyltransferase [Solirubrobacteraceae bacterium]
ERFYAARGLRPVVAVAPAEDHFALDAALDAAGWVAEGHTDVLVGESAALVLPAAGGVERVDPAHWPNAPIRDEVLSRSRDEVLAFAEGQSGAVLCIRTGALAGVFRLHVAPHAQRQGVASRLLAACATVAPVLYAQVETDNAPAQALFASAGFTCSHGYHYRSKRPG